MFYERPNKSKMKLFGYCVAAACCEYVDNYTIKKGLNTKKFKTRILRTDDLTIKSCSHCGSPLVFLAKSRPKR